MFYSSACLTLEVGFSEIQEVALRDPVYFKLPNGADVEEFLLEKKPDGSVRKLLCILFIV